MGWSPQRPVYARRGKEEGLRRRLGEAKKLLCRGLVWLLGRLDPTLLEKKGSSDDCTSPASSSFKQGIVKECARCRGLSTFVETGTYQGDMVEVVRRDMDRVYSIELSPELWEQARNRFLEDPKVTIILGSSAKKLAVVLGELDEPALFWLDGHYSGPGTARGEDDTPILEELWMLGEWFDENEDYESVVLIDDARLFGGRSSYPTEKQIADLVGCWHHPRNVWVADDIIRIVPDRKGR